MNILICFGTRPEAIKMAPVIHELRNKKIFHKICVTAQHREMLDQVLKFFEIKPDYDLDLMKKGQSLNELSAALFKAVDKVLQQVQPEMVLVQGDTTSAVIIAQAAFNRGIRIGHVEAGLRTFDRKAPFPEEMNRQLLSRLADLHFVPTKKARKHLLLENIGEEQIFLTGNTVVDALKWGKSKIRNSIRDNVVPPSLKHKIIPGKKLILVTGHRRENFGTGMESLCKSLIELVTRQEVQIIFPVHLNPSVREVVFKKLSGNDRITLVEPLDYPALLWLMDKTDIIISDSGGIQEEAPSFNTPVLVTREKSERMEGVEAGYSFLVGTNRKMIVKKAEELLKKPPGIEERENPYGDGTASKKIVKIITAALKNK